MLENLLKIWFSRCFYTWSWWFGGRGVGGWNTCRSLTTKPSLLAGEVLHEWYNILFPTHTKTALKLFQLTKLWVIKQTRWLDKGFLGQEKVDENGIFCHCTAMDSHFLLFHSGKVFHQLVCPLTVVLPQIFFNLTTLFPYPVFFSLFHAPLDVVVHSLVVLRSFRLKCFLSQFSPFVAQIENFCTNPGFFFWRCLLRISLAVSVTAVLKLVIIESVSVSSLLMMVRGAKLPPFQRLQRWDL